MFFVIPEMPSKPFVMGLKKLPDHFKYNPDFQCNLPYNQGRIQGGWQGEHYFPRFLWAIPHPRISKEEEKAEAKERKIWGNE